MSRESYNKHLELELWTNVVKAAPELIGGICLLWWYVDQIYGSILHFFK